MPSVAMRKVLERGTLCYLAALTERGPHVTPLVYAPWGDRIWITTSRGSVKARAWRRAPVAGGLVRAGNRAVVFTGRIRTYDALDPATWPASVIHAPSVALASAAFVLRNARFFAGYAVDAGRVPLAWTPPGRVFVEVLLARAPLLVDGQIVESWGAGHRASRSGGSGSPVSGTAFRARGRKGDPLGGLPASVRERLSPGDGALAVEWSNSVAVLPAAWGVVRGALYAAVPAGALEPDATEGEPRVALAADRASRWRAREMAGAMVQGTGDVHVLDRLVSGQSSASRLVRELGMEPEGAALIRITPRRVVWWLGWSSGTVDAG